jgi:hypothetical protein
MHQRHPFAQCGFLCPPGSSRNVEAGVLPKATGMSFFGNHLVVEAGEGGRTGLGASKRAFLLTPLGSWWLVLVMQ